MLFSTPWCPWGPESVGDVHNLFGRRHSEKIRPTTLMSQTQPWNPSFTQKVKVHLKNCFICTCSIAYILPRHLHLQHQSSIPQGHSLQHKYCHSPKTRGLANQRLRRPRRVCFNLIVFPTTSRLENQRGTGRTSRKVVPGSAACIHFIKGTK